MKAASSPSPENGDLFEINREHARDAYKNAQDAIRFVDSKTGVLIGVLTVTTGIPFALLQAMLSKEAGHTSKILAWYACCGCFAKFLAVATLILIASGVLFGILTLLSLTGVLIARHVPRRGDKQPHRLVELASFVIGKLRNAIGLKASALGNPHPELTCLFPAFAPERTDDAARKFHKLGAGEYTRKDILREYELQLECTGSILNAKISHNRDAVKWFECQIFSYMGAALLAVGLIALCLFGKVPKEPITGQALPTISPLARAAVPNHPAVPTQTPSPVTTPKLHQLVP